MTKTYSFFSLGWCKENMFQSAGEVRRLPVEFCVWPISFQMTAAVPLLQTHLGRENNKVPLL